MTHPCHQLHEWGVHVRVARNGNLKLSGLDALPPDQARDVVDFAKEHKDAILEALRNPWWSSGVEMAHPGSHTEDKTVHELVRHVPTGTFCLRRRDGVLLSICQGWARVRAGGWVQ